MKEFFLVILLILAVRNPAGCQQQAAPDDQRTYLELVMQSYGLDQTLVNGFQYFNRYAGYRGVPYFGTIGFQVGEATIAGRIYSGVPIRYNLMSQRLELEYRSPYLGYNWIELVSDHVEAFLFLGHTFRRINLEGGGPKFYQVIETGPFTCYIHWEKELQPVQNDQVFTHEFTRAEPTFLVAIREELIPVSNRKELARIFPADRQKEIKRLLKKNRFRMNLAAPEEVSFNMIQVAALYESSLLP